LRASSSWGAPERRFSQKGEISLRIKREMNRGKHQTERCKTENVSLMWSEQCVMKNWKLKLELEMKLDSHLWEGWLSLILFQICLLVLGMCATAKKHVKVLSFSNVFSQNTLIFLFSLTLTLTFIYLYTIFVYLNMKKVSNKDD